MDTKYTILQETKELLEQHRQTELDLMEVRKKRVHLEMKEEQLKNSFQEKFKNEKMVSIHI